MDDPVFQVTLVILWVYIIFMAVKRATQYIMQRKNGKNTTPETIPHSNIAPSGCREMTEEEMAGIIMDDIFDTIYFYEKQDQQDTREKLEGLAFSILVLLDGGANLPRMIVAPDPESGDRQHYIQEGENWIPENQNVKVNCNLGGGLHEYFHICKAEIMDRLKR